MRPRVAIIAALLILETRAAADPILHIKSPSTLTTEKGSTLRLPPGYFLDEPTWKDKDAHVRAVEDDLTRKNAENASLRKSASKQWFDWKVVVAAAAAGFAAGAVVNFVK
jgi:hypothetical protein